MPTILSHGGRRAGVLAAVIATVVGACSGSSSPTPVTPSAAPSQSASVASVAPSEASPSPAPSPSVEPSPTPAAAVALCGKERTACPVAAGRWYSAVFEPGFDITVGDGWANVWNYPQIGALANQPGSFVWMSHAFGLDDTLQIVKLAAGPAGVVAFLDKRKGIAVGPATPVTIDGASGLQVDATASRRLNGVLGATPTAPQLQAKSKTRYVIVDRNGSTVAFMVTADDGANFDSIMAQAQPMLDSITWR